MQATPRLPIALCLLGPTASGKSAAALALAQRFPLEIISVDSAQVFRDMNIGTAKPDAATQAQVPHHLIDLITPEESYSAARFRRDALHAMHEITARGKTPLLVGGTMLYFKALREGLSQMPSADAGLRAEIETAAREHGWAALHDELAQLDPLTAARLQPTDSQRIQRALEVIKLTGKPLAASYARKTDSPPPFDIITLALEPSDRSMLHQRIEQRFAAMLDLGLIEEVEKLRKKYTLHGELPSMRCVGYRQTWAYLEGKITRAELRDQGIYATRQLAKRQLTWLRAMTGIKVFDCLAPDVARQVTDYAASMALRT